MCVRALVPARCLTMTAQLSNGDGLRKVPQNEGGDDDSIAEQKARPWVRARRWPKGMAPADQSPVQVRFR